MAEMTLERLKKFLDKTGSVGIVVAAGDARMLNPNLSEYFDLAANANHIWYDRAWRSRKEFSELMDQIPN